MLTIQVSAQKLIFIPDINLRNELDKMGFVTNDSLDIKKTQGRLQLDLNNKGIENLEGLQYFDQVWRLVINNNKIKWLDNLPPNLTYLTCSNNEIRLIDNLPRNLKHLECNNNKISNIIHLPVHLTTLYFGNNLMKNIPILPKTIQFINYSNNPIPLDSLPKLFQNISCDDKSQNCLPYELMNWSILNANTKDTLLKITGMTIKLNSSYSWGLGSQVETINFKLKESKLVANKMEVNRIYQKGIQPNMNDSTYYNIVNYSVEVSKINQFLKDIYSNKMLVQIQIGDSLKSIDLRTQKNTGIIRELPCSDCTYHYLQYTIYSHTDTIKLNYGFNSGFRSRPIIFPTNEPVHIRAILDWLYIYKLIELTFNNNTTLRYYFNVDNLYSVIKCLR